MDREEIKKIIQEVNRETGGLVTFHKHNKIDAPPISFTDIENITFGAGLSYTNGILIVTGLTTTEISAATLVTAADTVAGNDNDTTWPTTAAIIDYVLASQTSLNFTTTTDTSVTDYYTIQIAAPNNLTGSVWTCTTSAVTHTDTPTGHTMLNSSSAGSDASAYTTDFLSIRSGSTAQFNSGTTHRLKCRFSTYPGEGTNQTNDKFGWFGWVSNGTNSTAFGYISNTSNVRAGFSFYDQKIYSTVCDGSATTANIVATYTGSTPGAAKTYEIVKNGTTNFLFYIDGTLVDTITTNIPTSGQSLISLASTIGGTYDHSGFPFISHLTYSEKLS